MKNKQFLFTALFLFSLLTFTKAQRSVDYWVYGAEGRTILVDKTNLPQSPTISQVYMALTMVLGVTPEHLSRTLEPYNRVVITKRTGIFRLVSLTEGPVYYYGGR